MNEMRFIFKKHVIKHFSAAACYNYDSLREIKLKFSCYEKYY